VPNILRVNGLSEMTPNPPVALDLGVWQDDGNGLRNLHATEALFEHGSATPTTFSQSLTHSAAFSSVAFSSAFFTEA
jgi:hypothetical protein